MNYKNNRTIEKEDRFKKAFIKFKESEKDTQDFLELFATVRSVTMLGDGLSYARLEQIMQEEI